MQILTSIVILTMSLSAIGQTSPPTRTPLTDYSYIDVDTETRYLESEGKGIIVRNSYPKGSPYTSPTGEDFGYTIFWTHIINETRTPLELTISFPADSFPILGSPDAYFKIYLPSDTMTFDKQYLYNYGATGLKAFLDNNFDKSTMLKRTINAKEEFVFYTLVVFHKAGRVLRTGLVLKDLQLFYRVNGLNTQPEFELIPCGRIVLQNKELK